MIYVIGVLFILYIKMKLPPNQLNRVKVKVLELNQSQRKSSEWQFN